MMVNVVQQQECEELQSVGNSFKYAHSEYILWGGGSQRQAKLSGWRFGYGFLEGVKHKFKFGPVSKIKCVPQIFNPQSICTKLLIL